MAAGRLLVPVVVWRAPFTESFADRLRDQDVMALARIARAARSTGESFGRRLLRGE